MLRKYLIPIWARRRRQTVRARSSRLCVRERDPVLNASKDAEDRSFLRFAGPSGGWDSSRLTGVGVVGSLTVRTSISKGAPSVADGTPSSSSLCHVRFLPLPTEREGGVEDGVVVAISGFVLKEDCESWEDSEEEDVLVGTEGGFALVGYSRARTRPNVSVCMDVDNWRCLAMISLGPRGGGGQDDG